MTAGNNGTGTPENDDPFGYLYRSEGGDGATEGGQQQTAARQPGVPRTSYNQVRPVGSRQYGQQPAAQRAQQPHPHYSAPETLPGGAPAASGPGAGAGAGRGSHGASDRPKRRGLLIAAIAVVAVVAGGIGVAVMTNSSDDKGTNAGGDSGKVVTDDSGKPDDSEKKKEKEKKDDQPKNPSANGLKKRDAASLRLSGGATTEKTVKGAEADGGLYITGMNQVGAAVEWTVDVDATGQYRLNVRYGVPGKDANLTVGANGKGDTRAIRMENFGGTKDGDWEAGWKNTWANVNLNKGTNTIKLSCEPGNKCDVHLDQVWISKG
ncbi:carbohydrate-binding protein [Streptomyces triculaminicus]|uniref:carbohydrate-binding protein n=1 Tax=Streptomyces triculaminicus TaxID=2816232 RepID=UPI0037D5E384